MTDMTSIESGNQITIVFTDSDRDSLVGKLLFKSEGLWYIEPLHWKDGHGKISAPPPPYKSMAINPLSSSILYIGKE